MTKKALLVVPFLALLAGCGEPPAHEHTYASSWTSNANQHWHAATCEHASLKKDLGEHVDADNDGKCDVCGYGEQKQEVDPDAKLAPAEFLGHKRADKLEEGKDYYLAVCKKNENNRMMFVNGNPHSDAKGEYPFYMAETEIDTAEKLQYAAKITVDYVEGSTTEFTLQVHKEGGKNDGKYVGVYLADSTYGNQVLSFYLADNVGDKHEGKEECYYNFSWLDKFEEYNINTAVIKIQDTRLGDDKPEPKFIGTGGEYISMDCSNADKAMNEDYNLGYFYEV